VTHACPSDTPTEKDTLTLFLAEMEKYSENSGLVEKLRQRLKESDL